MTAEFKIVISPADCGVWTHIHFYTDLRPWPHTLQNIYARKQAFNDKLRGSVAADLRCGGAVNNQKRKVYC